MKIGIYYINLKTSTQRREFMENQAMQQGLNIQRIEGVNVNDFSSEKLAEYQKASQDTLPLVKGEIGCCLAHREALKAFLESDNDYGIILEDDAILSENFMDKIRLCAKNLEKLQHPWDVLRLNIPETKKYLLSKIASFSDYSIHIPSRVPMNTLSLIYNRTSAEKVLQYPACQYSWDTMFRDPYFDYLCLLPPIVSAQSDFQSDLTSLSEREAVPHPKGLFLEAEFFRLFHYTYLKLGLKAALKIELRRILQKLSPKKPY